MGCLQNRDSQMEFFEILVSDGRPKRVNFKQRNRQIVRVMTYDKEMTFSHNGDSVFFHGPRGAEAIVVFTIG